MSEHRLTSLSGLRAGRAGCPSDLVLDRLCAGELDPPEEARVRGHVTSCAPCSAHLSGASFEADVDAAALLGRVRAGVAAAAAAAPVAERARVSWRRRARGPLLALAAAACAAGVVVAVQPPTEGVREKGGLSLRVHRQAAQGSEEVLSGAHLRAGERLRFQIDLPREGYVMIVGVEQGGALYAAWPSDGAPAQRRPAGRGQVLPGAVALDDSTGRETLYLVHCPSAKEPPRCAAPAPGAAPPRCPEGCALSPFALVKDKAP